MRKNIIASLTLTVDSISVPISVIRSNRARRVRLVSKRGLQFELILPKRFSEKNVSTLIDKFTPWITLRVRERQSYDSDAMTPKLEPGGSILFLGKLLSLKVQIDEDGLFSVQRRDDVLEITVAEGQVNRIPNLSILWLRHQAEKELPKRLMNWSIQLNKRVHKLRIKDQKTLWGSCSSRGNINLNWRLILLPEEVVDYIIIHELCHFFVPGHSARFWHVVAEHCPSYKTHRSWLRQNRWLLEFGRDLLYCDEPGGHSH